MSNEDFSESINKAKLQVAKNMMASIEKACIVIEADAKKNCPVETGTLKASINNNVDAEGAKIVGHVGTNLEYAAYVHQGTGIYAIDGNGRKTPWRYKDKEGHFIITHGQKPQPFLDNAKTSNIRKIEMILREGLL